MGFPAICFKIVLRKNSGIIKVKIMTTNAEVDCNEKDYSNGKSEGNILIFICVKLHFLRQCQVYKLNPLVISLSQFCLSQETV